MTLEHPESVLEVLDFEAKAGKAENGSQVALDRPDVLLLGLLNELGSDGLVVLELNQLLLKQIMKGLVLDQELSQILSDLDLLQIGERLKQVGPQHSGSTVC